MKNDFMGQLDKMGGNLERTRAIVTILSGDMTRAANNDECILTEALSASLLWQLENNLEELDSTLLQISIDYRAGLRG